MKLSELRISDFALFATRRFSLQSGVNLVAGTNSSGKSVVFQALQAALANRLPDGVTSSDDEAPPAVAVQLQYQGKEQKIERVFGHSDDHVAADLQDPALPLLLEAGFWQEGGLLNLPADQLSRQLRTLTLSDNQSGTQALPRLQDEYRKLTSRDPWGEDREDPGELEQIRERLVEIETDWEARLSALKQLGSMRNEMPREAETSPAAVISEEIVREPTEVTAEDIESSPSQPLDDFDQPEAPESTETSFDETWDDPGFDASPAEDPPKVRERLWAVQKEAAELRQELVSVPSLSALLPIVLTVLFLVLCGALVAFHRDLWQAASMAGAALILCTWAVYGYLARNKGTELNRLRERLSRAENEREELLQTLDRLDEQRRYGSVEDDDSHDTYSEVSSELPVVESTEEPGEETLPSAEPDPKVSFWQQRRRLLSEVSDLRSLEMEGESLRYREQQIVTRLKVLTTAIEMLLQAEDHFGGERRSQFTEAFSSYLEQLLPGNPLQVSLGKNWHLQMVRGEQRRPVHLRLLSRGEKTMLSLALHLSLLQMCGQSSLPLIADDLFDDLQDELRDTAVKVLKNFSDRHQVVVTSRDPDIRTRALSLGWNVIDLDKVQKPPQKPVKKTVKEGSSEDEQQLHLL